MIQLWQDLLVDQVSCLSEIVSLQSMIDRGLDIPICLVPAAGRAGEARVSIPAASESTGYVASRRKGGDSGTSVVLRPGGHRTGWQPPDALIPCRCQIARSLRRTVDR